jgi:hypothetical protein
MLKSKKVFSKINHKKINFRIIIYLLLIKCTTKLSSVRSIHYYCHDLLNAVAVRDLILSPFLNLIVGIESNLLVELKLIL